VAIIRRFLPAALVVFALVGSAQARNDAYFLSNADVASDPAFKELGSNVTFYFANQTAPRVAQNLGTFVGNKIAKTRGKSDEQWCKEAALGALSELRDEASKRGGDAVVNIQSLWKGNGIADKTKYECHAGGTGGHVSLQGTIVKLAK
jgi:uncharacterized protein YbjQ (UPF0145 family)